MRFPILVYVYIIIFINWTVVKSTGSSAFTNLSSWYGEGYGTEWIFFPDGDGIPHYVSLTGTGEDMPQTRSGFNNIEYRLYIRNNLTDSVVLNETADPEVPIEIDLELSKLPLKMITHGWRSSAESKAVAAIKNAYLLKKDVNVITVDWSYIANSIFYNWVANQTEMIGAEIATFLNSLSEKHNVSGDRIHLIGHSLGAHVMGIAAYQSDLIIDRCTGLDPARPLFEYPSRNASSRLDSTDANFVDIIHTCGGILGIESNVGTVDFFPNSGIPPQPGCETIPKILEACSHGRSYFYYAESISNPKGFPSNQCNSWFEFLEKQCNSSQTVFMGDGVSRDITGKYYLTTKSKEPFGRTQT